MYTHKHTSEHFLNGQVAMTCRKALGQKKRTHNNTTINYGPERGKKVQSKNYRDVGQTGGATASGQRRKMEKEEGMTERMEERQTAGHRFNQAVG